MSAIKFKHSLAIIIGMLGLIAVFLLWLFFSGNSVLKTAFLKALPMPTILVENKTIYSNEIFARIDSAKLVYAKNKNFNAGSARTEILDRLIWEKQLEVLALSRSAKLANWKNFQSDSQTRNPGPILEKAYESLGREEAFKFWFYSQKDLNPTGYSVFDEIKQQLASGTPFSTLAKQYSADSNSAQTSGDIGPIELKNLLYELREPVAQAQLQETLYLPSRIGLHVVQVYQKINIDGKDVVYLRQIFIKGSDFEAWVKNETKNYKIKYLLEF